MKTLKFFFALVVMLFTMQCTTAKAPEPQNTQFEKAMTPQEIQKHILSLSDTDAETFVQSLYSTEQGKKVLAKLKGLPVAQEVLNELINFTSAPVQMIKDDIMVFWMPIAPEDFGNHNSSNISLGSVIVKELSYNSVSQSWEVSNTFNTGITASNFNPASTIPYLMSVELTFASGTFTGRNKRYLLEINTVTGVLLTPYKKHTINLFTT